ncbi:bifunctional PIG-L family deacetylase/class I SAM-dependent methyltransferase [Rothia sp. ARF10]|nr:bifunctional PIG-L family deacetylase/class I SAM-dependent methyltransferase [Rothia sp. ARF10]
MRDGRWADVAHTDARGALTAYDRLLVVAAHPDDECLGAGLLLADAHDLGLEVTVLVLTDGEGSHPDSPTVTADEMRRRRGTEVDRAMAVLVPGARVLHAGLPDGGLTERHAEVVEAVRGHLSARTLVLAPWVADGHPDHDATGRAAAEAVEPGDGTVALAHYLVWLWHWSGPEDLPWERVVAVDASLEGIRRSALAVAEHRSQVAPLSPEPGDERLLTEGVLAPSRRGFTTLLLGRGVDPPEPAAGAGGRVADFDAMFDDGDDPWSSGSFYERRKRDLSLAVLRRARYERVLDVGCSTGSLTRALAERAGEVVAVDGSGPALEVARRDAPGNVSWVQGVAPTVLGSVEGPFDLVVLSEVLYFLTPFEVWRTLGSVLARLAPRAEVVLVDWRHATERIPLDGPAVHELVRGVCARWGSVAHVEPDVLLDTYEVTA